MPGPIRTLHIERTVAAMTAITLVGQLLALLRESAIAAEFGASSLTDSFLLAIMIPNAILLLVQNGLLMALIPVLAEVLTQKGEEQVWLSASNLINWILLLLTFASIIIAVIAHPAVSLLAPSLTKGEHELVVHMLWCLVTVNILGGLAAVLGGILNVYRVFTPPALFNLVLNAITIAGILTLADSLSIWALVIATIAGYAIQGLLLIINLRPIHQFRWVFGVRDPAVARLARLTWPAVMTLALQQAIVFVDRVVAVRLGAGQISALNFASRLVLAGSPLLIGALSTIALPELSRTVAAGEPDRIRPMTVSLLRYALFLASPVAALLYVLRRPITVLAFQRGAFDLHATELTTGPMAFYAITLLVLCVREIVVRFFYASHDMRTPLATGVIRMGLNAWLDVTLARIMQSRGIALANAVAISADVMIMLLIMIRRWRIKVNLIYPLKIGAATAVLAFCSSFVLGHVSTSMHVVDCLLSAFLAGAVGGASYWLASMVLNVRESRALFAKGVHILRSIRR